MSCDLPFQDRMNPVPRVDAYLLTDNGRFPNNPKTPLLIYRAVLRALESGPEVFEQIFAHWNWQDSWRDGIYPYHHYHSTSHEVLGVYTGHAAVRFGGEGKPGMTLVLKTGDVAVIPAGVAHCNLGASDGFGVVGAYPDGHRWDLLTGRAGERPKADENIAGLPLPGNDPLYGPEGPLRQAWQVGAG